MDLGPLTLYTTEKKKKKKNHQQPGGMVGRPAIPEPILLRVCHVAHGHPMWITSNMTEDLGEREN